MATLPRKTIPTHDFLAVHGYVHKSFDDDLTLYIPEDVINLIVIWYYDVSLWKLKDAQLSKFFSLKNGEAMYSKPFQINDITFHLSLCPNGWKHSQKGFVQYYLEIKAMPSNILSFTVYFEFYCFETQSVWKGIRILSKVKDAVGWYHYTLPFAQCKNLKCLTFGSCIEILNINYLISSKENKINCIQQRHLKLQKYIHKTWILHKYPIQRFKHCLYPKNFHSPTFENGYFCFECQANFEYNILIYCRLKLIRMPFHIQTMKIKCQLQTNMKCESNKNENGMDRKSDICEWETVDLSFEHNYTKWKAYLTHSNSGQNSEIDSIRISVNIEILEIMDWNNVRIEQSLWHKYGIICDGKKQSKNGGMPKTDEQTQMSIQYADDVSNSEIIQNYNRQMIVTKEWIKPNFLNIPST